MSYYSTNQVEVEFSNTQEIQDFYTKGFVLTRLGKGVMQQTRSLRIDLSKFDLTSENKRVLRKTDVLNLNFLELPLENYSWEIHKMGKDFYSKKFGEGTMSASKIKEMFNDSDKSNMNGVFQFIVKEKYVGYCLVFKTSEIIHYAYPFYDLEIAESVPNFGLGMMTRSIIWAKESQLSYIYLGSVTDLKAKYKLQFKGLEWWNGDQWNSDINELKALLTDA